MSDPARDDAAWEEYLAAARRLDALRRGAATAEDDPARATTATVEELTRVRARLAAQHTRLRGLGVPEEELRPSSAELATATLEGRKPDGLADDGGLAADGLGIVWSSLRRSRALAEHADTVLAPPRGWAALRRWAWRRRK